MHAFVVQVLAVQLLIVMMLQLLIRPMRLRLLPRGDRALRQSAVLVMKLWLSLNAPHRAMNLRVMRTALSLTVTLSQMRSLVAKFLFLMEECTLAENGRPSFPGYITTYRARATAAKFASYLVRTYS